MDEINFQANMDTLKEMLLDEEKLLTYISLSKDLCIHVNDGKKLLTKLVEEIKKKQADIQLNVSYIVSGLSEGNKARTLVLPVQELDTFKKKFKLVFFEHIYSVSKGKSTIDNVALLANNKLEDLTLCTGLIKSTSCSKHSVAELGALKSNSQSSVSVVQKLEAVSQKKIKEEPRNHVQTQLKDVSKPEPNYSEPNVKKESSSPKKEKTNDLKPKADSKKNLPKTQKGIAGFFSKSNNVSSNKKVEKESPSKKEIKQEKEEMDVDIDIGEEEVLEKDNKKTENISKKSENNTIKKTQNGVKKLENGTKELENGKKHLENGTTNSEKETKSSENGLKKDKKEVKKTNSKTKSVSEIKKNAKVDKKRKRVLQVSDSESDEEKDPFVDDTPVKSEHESDDEIPPTPVPTVKITSGLIHPRKKRKIVDKTYTDEDGYILTKKEEVFESCSDNEDVKEEAIVQKPPKVEIKQEISPKKTVPKNSKKKISPPQKGKQATLMNFFKKV